MGSRRIAKNTIRFLTANDVILLHTHYINPNPTLLHRTMLESAVDSPVKVQHYEGQNDVFQLAACLSAKLIKNHAFTDGNKRTGMVAALVFLRRNGYQLQKDVFSDDDAAKSFAEAHTAVAESKSGMEQLGKEYEIASTDSGGAECCTN